MNIHEYQAKQVLKGFGAPIANGVPVTSLDQAESAISALPGPVWVVKSQIHAGGRGKGKFKELAEDAKGGVRVSFSADEALSNVKEMFGNTLVTKQTGPAGKQVNRLYIEDGADIESELYLQRWRGHFASFLFRGGAIDAGVHGLQEALGEGVATGNIADAVSALTNLGYAQAQASGAVARIVARDGNDTDAQTLIRLGLKELSGG